MFRRFIFTLAVNLALFMNVPIVSPATEPNTSSQSRTNLATPTPPVAKKVPKEIVAHGDKRIDDYFWLREKTNAEVIAYLEEENAYAEALTRPLGKLRDHLYQEMISHLKETDSSAP